MSAFEADDDNAPQNSGVLGNNAMEDKPVPELNVVKSQSKKAAIKERTDLNLKRNEELVAQYDQVVDCPDFIATEAKDRRIRGEYLAANGKAKDGFVRCTPGMKFKTCKYQKNDENYNKLRYCVVNDKKSRLDRYAKICAAFSDEDIAAARAKYPPQEKTAKKTKSTKSKSPSQTQRKRKSQVNKYKSAEFIDSADDRDEQGHKRQSPKVAFQSQPEVREISRGPTSTEQKQITNLLGKDSYYKSLRKEVEENVRTNPTKYGAKIQIQSNKHAKEFATAYTRKRIFDDLRTKKTPTKSPRQTKKKPSKTPRQNKKKSNTPSASRKSTNSLTKDELVEQLFRDPDQFNL